MREKIEFNSNGVTLAGLLERPASEAKAYAILAHCFTCGKDLAAASRIAGKLVEQGIAVLRFDFTGLGNSDGDFANTNFSSNLQDLKAAAEFLTQSYKPPSLLIGHSLGGVACLSVADDIASVKAVVTIGAAASTKHLKNHFLSVVSEVEKTGEATVNLGLRQFTVKQQFLDDLNLHSEKHFRMRNKALLIMHSPADEEVPIEEAEKIYQWAKHPKSFVSLDKADHLLSASKDSQYAATVIAGWVSKYVLDESSYNTKPSTDSVTQDFVSIEEKDHKFTQRVIGFHHTWLADEPFEAGGQNLGPSPYEHVMAGLGACTSMTVRMYASLKKLPLEDAAVHVRHIRHEDGSQEFVRELNLTGELNAQERDKILSIANKCPVHKTLTGKLKISTTLL